MGLSDALILMSQSSPNGVYISIIKVAPVAGKALSVAGIEIQCLLIVKGADEHESIVPVMTAFGCAVPSQKVMANYCLIFGVTDLKAVRPRQVPTFLVT